MSLLRFHLAIVHLQESLCHLPPLARGGAEAPHCIISQMADLPQPWQRAMALPLTFTAPSGAGFSRSRVKRRMNRYHRSSDAL